MGYHRILWIHYVYCLWVSSNGGSQVTMVVSIRVVMVIHDLDDDWGSHHFRTPLCVYCISIPKKIEVMGIKVPKVHVCTQIFKHTKQQISG
jgi:hypothetical protein